MNEPPAPPTIGDAWRQAKEKLHRQALEDLRLECMKIATQQLGRKCEWWDYVTRASEIYNHIKAAE